MTEFLATDGGTRRHATSTEKKSRAKKKETVKEAMTNRKSVCK